MGLIICAIIILIIGAISSIGINSFENLREKATVYSDVLYYGFDLIKNSVRKAHAIDINYLPSPSDGQWVSQAIIADARAFALFKQNTSPAIDFVYLKDKTKPDERDVIFYQADNMSLTPAINGKLLTINIQGVKNDESFDLTTSVMKRN